MEPTETSQSIRVAAHKIATEVSCTIKPLSAPGQDVIIVSWETDFEDVNGHHKASIIDKVYQSDADVKLKDSNDGAKAVIFELRE